MIRAAAAMTVKLLCGCHGRWREAPDVARPHVFFANHTSHLDAIVVWAALPREMRRACATVAAADYWAAGALRHWLATRVFDAILVDRARVTKSSNPLIPMQARLDRGDSIIIFPEGTRGGGAAVAPFRSGIWRLARANPGVRFVPVWIENLNRVMPKGEILPVPILVAVTFGPPLALVPDEPKLAFLNRARDAVVNLREAPQ